MRILMAAAAVVVAGCSNTLISADKADPLPLNRIYAFTQKSDSELVVTRDSGMYQVGLKIKLYVDGTLAAEFGQGEVGRFSLTQGPHILAVSDGSVLVESEIELLPGQTMRRRISITMQGIELSPTAI